MMQPVIILGAGGHARVLVDILRIDGREIIGVLDNKRILDGKEFLKLSILGDDDFLLVSNNYLPEDVELVNGIGSVNIPVRRKEVFIKFKQKKYVFATLVHAKAIIARDVCIGEGSQIMAGAILQSGSCIGENVIINTGASLDHDCIIGAHVHIAPGAVISGGVVVGEQTHIGVGAVIIQGVNIGKNVVIGASALVLRDIPDGITIVGVPGKSMPR